MRTGLAAGDMKILPGPQPGRDTATSRYRINGSSPETLTNRAIREGLQYAIPQTEPAHGR